MPWPCYARGMTSEPKFPRLNWANEPDLDLRSSRETRRIGLRLPLTEEPGEDWRKHFKKALSESSIGMDVDCEVAGETLVVYCSPPLEPGLPFVVDRVLQMAGIAWLNERDKERQWAAAMRSAFSELKAEWAKKRSS